MMLRFAICLGLALAAPVSAQSVRGVTLGEPVPGSMPPPTGRQTVAPYAYTLWNLGDNPFSATTDAETGEVLYVEAWANPAIGQPAHIDGLYYGVTTRADLHERFGSEGIVFEGRGRVADLPEIAVYFITYEVEDSDIVVSFVTIQPLDEASAETADASVLDSVIFADGTYLSQIWGLNRGRLSDYEPIADPFTAD